MERGREWNREKEEEREGGRKREIDDARGRKQAPKKAVISHQVAPF